MATLQIPVDSVDPSYDFQIDLEGVTYTLDFDYNERAQQWQMSILNSTGDALILGSLPLLTDTSLLYQYVGIVELPPGSFFLFDDTNQNRNPNRDNLGTEVNLYYEERN